MKLLLIYNPYSGKGKNKKYGKLKSILDNKFDVTSFKSNGIGSITNYLLNDNNTYDVIVICGGDGTINEAIDAISKFNYYPKIAVIPFGTMNDFSHYLKMSKNIKKSANYIINMKTIPHDIYKINDGIVVYGFGLGMLSNISYKNNKFKKIFGRLSYYFLAIKELFISKKLDVSININNNNINMKCNLILASTTNRLAGYKIKKGNNLKIVIIKGFRFLYPFKLYWYFITGYAKYKYDVTDIKISSNYESFTIDGEEARGSNIMISKYKTFDFITK